MGNRRRTIYSTLLAVIYTLFFVSTGFFYHTHKLTDSTIFHSHPYSNACHSHNNTQIVFIDNLDSAVYEESACICVPEPFDGTCGSIGTLCHTALLPVSPYNYFSLRAPPAGC